MFIERVQVATEALLALFYYSIKDLQKLQTGLVHAWLIAGGSLDINI